ncbi:MULTISPECIES: transposase [unclassified Chromohalobacter]|uniref:transposase n=1 Tax=unclassified Chromohalobacter TaxID=2628571 RepID=UPI00246966E8|nr:MULTISPECIES: transposase [unclassified Chromohalobacter]
MDSAGVEAACRPVAHYELPQDHARSGRRSALLKPMAKALTTLERHAEQVVRRRLSGLTNARQEGMNGLFQAARSRARGYRNETNFIAMIYLIGSPVGHFLDQAKST